MEASCVAWVSSKVEQKTSPTKVSLQQKNAESQILIGRILRITSKKLLIQSVIIKTNGSLIDSRHI